MSLPTFSASTTAEEVADTFAAQIRGKNVLITGTSLNGLGFEAARVIAKYANLVIITGYNSERLKLSEEALKKETSRGANIRPLVLDLASLASVRKAAAEVNAYPDPLHVLVHNAAHGGGDFTLTPDGFEIQMATGQFGPFLFTKLLAPKLLASASADFTPRVVFVSSDAHLFGTGVDFENLVDPKPEKHQNMATYMQVKSANVMFAGELSRRSGGKIKGYSLHPGTIFTNIMQKEANKKDLAGFGILNADGTPNTNSQFPFKTIPQGAATTVVAAFDTRIEDHPGSYLVDGVLAADKAAPHSVDPENAKKLWDLTEQIVGEKFTF
ncbi:short-chain dehydrogenase/reductase family protein [Favolaschia claudopus]|uniref:Short-chain dehydrogenase/reductase family protein n=1 Tax=Favolaschia claudopus TaxID=2862362 RepID=A0AAW0CZF2_9AGAR